MTCETTGWTEFDPELLVYKDDDVHGSVLLSEISGLRRFWIAIGVSEASVLNWRFDRTTFARPLTHDALATTISMLGGKLREVLIDKLIADQRLFHAKLQIDHLHKVVAVDVRPSDALIMAIASRVPIFVANDVLSQCHPDVLPGTGRG
jgi:hypothetical protein